MSARKRKGKQNDHKLMADGYVNDAHGRWVKAKDSSYARRAERNAKRNRLNRLKKKLRSSGDWKAAVERARSVLRNSGDDSEPLDWFVSSIYSKLKGKKNAESKVRPAEQRSR